LPGHVRGRLDALVSMAGIVFGSFLFAVLYPVLEGFSLSSDMGVMTIQKLLGTGHWAVIICLLRLISGGDDGRHANADPL
jgi:hypothetical protein